MMNYLMTTVAVLGLTLLGGCGWSLGASSTEQVQKPTVGQQLIDLQKANATGALSDAEYAKKRKEVIDAAVAAP